MGYLIDIERFYDAPRPTLEVSPRALALHRQCLVIDLHCDCVLWSRDLLRRNRHGHVDLPRMREGGLDVLTVSAPTSRIIVPQAIHRRWPRATWTSHWRRFLHQVDEVARQLERSGGEARLVRTAAEARAAKRDGRLAVVHGIEGAMALERDPARMAEAARRGVIYTGLTHFFDNEYGGHGGGDGRGLSALGARVVDAMNESGVLLDTAHASSRTLRDAVERTAFPPICSHTGVKAVKDHWRNLPDDDIRAIAAKGGVIGVMFGGMALRKPTCEEWLLHLEHVIDLVGEDHVALGSDWDGFIRPAVDAASLPQLTEAMCRRGFSDERIRKVLGESFLRVWEARDRAMAARAPAPAGAHGPTFDGAEHRQATSKETRT